jgi:hypothetical protein
MIKKNLVSFFAASAMALSVGIISANAAVESGMDLEYVASDVATERIVKVYYAGTETPTSGVSGANICLNVVGADIEGVAYILPTSTGDVKFDTPEDPVFENGQIFLNLVAGGRVAAENQELVTFVLTVPEGTGEFTISVDTDESYLFDGLNEEWYIACDAETLTIPGAKVEEEEEEPETIAATPAGKFEKWADAKTQAFKANLTAAQVAKTVTWKVTDGTNTKTAAANLGTVTGVDMVIGLIVTNAVNGLSATVVVE